MFKKVEKNVNEDKKYFIRMIEDCEIPSAELIFINRQTRLLERSYVTKGLIRTMEYAHILGDLDRYYELVSDRGFTEVDGVEFEKFYNWA